MIFRKIIDWFIGEGVKAFTQPLLRAYELKQAATTNEARIEADKDIARLEAARDIAVIEAQDRWSATRVGRLLIVVPFGVWWASIYLVQIPNGLLGTAFTVIDVPAHIHDMALVLIPTIIIGDAGALLAKRFSKR